MYSKHFDFLILGAGLSGIGAACHITRKLSGKTYAILEGRDSIGGTWDLFRYPGIRSDSDMTTFGYNFRPWNSPKMLADGPSIKQYMQDAADEYGVVPHIHFNHQVLRSEWSSKHSRWTVTATNKLTGEEQVYTSRFLISATGYYNHNRAYTPDFPDQKDFQGQLIHPQFWPEELDYRGKKVVIIGSGATAVTLVPTMANQGAQVTMLQRSPTYVISVPGLDPVWKHLNRVLPTTPAYFLLRIRNVLQGRLLFKGAQKHPQLVKSLLLNRVKKQLQGKVDMVHFTPHYNPWEQRLCAVPDGDMFKIIREGRADIVTDTIKAFDKTGIQLNSGRHLDADIIVTATGLELQSFGGADVVVDGQKININEHMLYKGMLLENIPNFLYIFGYSNASWTLKADIVIEHFLRIVRHMDKKGMHKVVAKASHSDTEATHSLSHFSSGYVQRGAHTLPRQGTEKPWIMLDDYLGDAIALKLSPMTDRELKYNA